MAEKLLNVNNLTVSMRSGNSSLKIIRGFELNLSKGEIVGILGESGSGKTVSSNMIARIYDADDGTIDSGSILFLGDDIRLMGEDDLSDIRGKRISYIFQNPSQSLNPYKKAGHQLEELLKVHKIESSKKTILNAMREVGLEKPELVYDMYPFQLSGGQNQRIMICQCILMKPDLLIADEPTSSIDAMLRKKILDLLIGMNKKYGTSIIFITHDFDVARYLCSRLVIMYGGLVVEEGGIDNILSNPMHPYTEELIKCSESLDSSEKVLYSLEGRPPAPMEFKDECPFIDRCRYKEESCAEAIPELMEIDKGKSRCPIRLRREGENSE
ncbi:MAG: ABC transporter ATP-binding protein [Clostridia bacterium]|nr:ABC transporter ATP-binding protein [Clostridia bacterium]